MRPEDISFQSRLVAQGSVDAKPDPAVSAASASSLCPKKACPTSMLAGPLQAGAVIRSVARNGHALYPESPSNSRSIMSLTRSSVVLMLAVLVAGCSVEQSKPQSAAGEAASDKTFKPAQYSVADFYANKGFFGASFSPDRQKILVGSNTLSLIHISEPTRLLS